MDIQQRVQILIGGDATQAKKVIKEVEDELKSSQARKIASSKQSGKQNAEAFGQAFNQAQDRWLKLAEDGFRKYGGRVGGIVANVIGQLDRIRKAKDATLRAGNLANAVSGTQGGNVVVGEEGSGSNIVTDYAATKVALSQLERRVLKVKGMGEVPLIESAGVTATDMAARRLSMRERYGKFRSRGFFRVPTMDELKDTYSPSGIGRAASNVGSALKGGIGRAASAAGGAVLGAVSGIGLGVAAGAGVVGGAFMGLSALANKAKENAETRKQIVLAQELIKEIENIQDPVKRTTAIIEKFGANGQEEFRNLKNEVKELQKNLGSEDWQNAADKAAYAWKSIKDTFNEYVVGPITSGLGTVVNAFAGILTGMNDEMMEYARKTEATIQANQRKIDELRAKNAKIAKENEEKRLRLQEKINEEADKAYDLLRDDVPLRQQQVELEGIINGLQSKKNKSLEEEYNLRKAINELIIVDKKLREEDKGQSEEDAAEERRRAEIAHEASLKRANAPTLIERMGKTAEPYLGSRATLPYTAPSSYGPSPNQVYQAGWGYPAKPGTLGSSINSGKGYIKGGSYAATVGTGVPNVQYNPFTQDSIRTKQVRNERPFGVLSKGVPINQNNMTLEKFFQEKGYIPVKPNNGK